MDMVSQQSVIIKRHNLWYLARLRSHALWWGLLLGNSRVATKSTAIRNNIHLFIQHLLVSNI